MKKYARKAQEGGIRGIYNLPFFPYLITAIWPWMIRGHGRYRKGVLVRASLVRVAPIIQEGLLNFVSSVPLYVTEAPVAAFFTYYFLIYGRGLIANKELIAKMNYPWTRIGYDG